MSLDFHALGDEALTRIYDEHLVPETAALIDGETDYIINLANVAAILYHGLKQVRLLIRPHHISVVSIGVHNHSRATSPSWFCCRITVHSTRAQLPSIGPVFTL